MKCEQTKSGWTVFKDALAFYLEAEGYNCIDDTCNTCYFGKNEKTFFILPLCELESLRIWRKTADDYNSPAIFLISEKNETPDKELFGNPKFGNIAKAIFLAEAVTDETSEKSYRNWPFQNVLNVADGTFPGNLIQLIENHKKIIPNFEKYRREFYATFVDYYYVDDFDFIRNIDQSANILLFEAIMDKMLKSKFIDKKKYNKLSSLSKNDVDSLITCADIIHCYLNDINYNDFTHRVDHELFRAPIPFPLQKLVDAEEKIRKELSKNDNENDGRNTIKLLLIDNKIDKVVNNNNNNKKNGQKTLGCLFQDIKQLGDLFELRMLGKTDWTKMSELSNNGNFKGEESETFKFDEFGKDLKNYKLSNSEDQSLKKFEYLLNIYNRIKKAHFVLLDFFLNEENTYLAFDFIRDIADIKRRKGNVSTTWYFITSAVYDSVVKYSQSGLLAEYYESAVVSAGDDPTNKKRQIIFLYKLLTFINARFTNFERYKNFIHKKLFADSGNDEACNESQPYCKEYKEKECPLCNDKDCLKGLQNDIKRYLTEYDDVCSIFYDKKDNNDLKDIIESLDNVIKQFIWLPEADWYMIQHQIDFINNKLRRLQDKNLKKRKFSCRYIIKELEDRSEVY